MTTVHQLLITKVFILFYFENNHSYKILHLSPKKVSLHCRMSKWINLPPSTRSLVKLLLYCAVTQSCLVNHVYVMTSCFIMHTPTTISAIEHLNACHFHKRNACCASITTKNVKSLPPYKSTCICRHTENCFITTAYTNSNWPASTSFLTCS